MVLRSSQYDDLYFSAQDGLAETRHVFLDGNNLPAAWQKEDREHFTIAETGFGTGLNFLAAWKLFEDTAAPHQKLHFISVEKHPLDIKTIIEALKPWQEELSAQIGVYEKNYPAVATDRVTLTLHIGDANDILPTLTESVDAWFLDGFRPASNPDMWSDAVLKEVARMTRCGGTLATFTAAGFVRRGLEAQGFEVTKIPGFGRKREMITGVKT